MNFKKTLALLLAGLMIAATLVGCGGQKDPVTDPVT